MRAGPWDTAPMPDGRRVRRPHDPRAPRPAAATAVPDATSGPFDRALDLRTAIEAAGYYPEAVSEGVEAALVGERVVEFLVHHEPTFDHDEVRRHVTVVVLTPTRLVVAHTDEHPPDDLLPSPYTATTTEAVTLPAVRSVVVQRMVAHPEPDAGRTAGGLPSEAVLTVAWGAVRRVDMEPAQCADPECEADHGYSGTLSADDFSIRVSAAADGSDAVERLLAFAGALSESTVRA